MKAKAFKDISLNIIASGICTASLNIIVYPLLAKRFSPSVYGNIITMVGVINLLWAVLGNCLNNTRLILNKNTEVDNSSGTYNYLLMIAASVGGIIGLIILSFFSISEPISLALSLLAIIIGILRAYYLVEFRLNLNYYAQLKNNIIVAAGYVLGVVFVHKTAFWPLFFIIGEGLALVSIIKNSSLVSEPFRLSHNKDVVIPTYVDLILTGLIGNIIAYFDRFLINPVLGSAAVAVFSVACFWGKIVTPLISPTANVLLSYLSQDESTVSIKRFNTLFFAGVIPLLLFAIIGIWVAPWLTGFLYPTLIEQALPYILIASSGSLIQSSTNLLMPLILTVCSSRKVLFMQIVYFLFYLVFAFVGAKLYGLMGFCISLCFIGLIKVLIYYCFGKRDIRKYNNKLVLDR